MRAEDRLPATAIIWGAMLCIFWFTPVGNETFQVMVVSAIALISTVAVWGGTYFGKRDTTRLQPSTAFDYEKPKRSANTTRENISLLSDAELDILEARMEARRALRDEDDQIAMNRLRAARNRQAE